MTSAIPQHSSTTPEHYTPPEFLTAAREVMGAIDLDPASTPSVNAAHVHASEIFTRADDGLTKEWRGRVWLNPPGGKLKRVDGRYVPVKDGPGESSAAVWWRKLSAEYVAGRVEEAIFLAFTLEILRSTQGSGGTWPGACSFCVPSSRIRFLTEVDGGQFVAGMSPTHANLIVHLPYRGNLYESSARFKVAFSRFGEVRT